VVKLKRDLGLFQITVAGIGIILGAGIYALIGVAASQAGNLTWLAFLISAFIAFFTGLSYAELSSMFRGDAGEYDYVSSAFNKKIGIVMGISMIGAGVVTSSAVALGFAGYFTSLVDMPYVLAAMLLILLTTTINFIGIKEASWFNTLSTLIEFLGLIIIVAIGIKYLGNVNLIENPNGNVGLFSAAALVFFAYMGFESIIKLSEETKNPEKNIPLAIMLSIGITSIVYVLVAISAVSVVGWEALATSAAPLSLVAQTALGSISGKILAIIALFSTANTVLMALVTSSRQIYGMAKKGSLPKVLGKIHLRTGTPWVAVLGISLLTIIFTLLGDLELVANITNFFLFLTFIAVNLSLIILRYKSPQIKRPFRVPGSIGNLALLPLIGVLSSTFMIVFMIWNAFF
jgi:basic amino acid/polyamine antiporter, APA family